ncbi:MAG: hypothetical protein JO197_12785 [Acidobacteria bacterium]|nr:hypothetical protein [Acidobacteriota bacterium]MBV9478255.1 hypothetical protein [Acidobacteriota bacterium]
MSNVKETPRSPLSFEDFIEAATSAAMRATRRDPDLKPFPIWVGIIIRDPHTIETIGKPNAG